MTDPSNQVNGQRDGSDEAEGGALTAPLASEVAPSSRASGAVDREQQPVVARPGMTVLLITSTLFWTVGSLVALFLLAMSAMLFDAPGSENNPWAWGIVYSLAALPALSGLVTIPCCVYGLWREFRRPLRPRTIGIFVALPTLGLVTLAFCWVALSVLCGGQLSCSEPWTLP